VDKETVPNKHREQIMAKKPNYDFERRERERQKAEKKAQRAAAKKEAKEAKARGETDESGDTELPTVSDE
jgi:hypothetical protein